MLVGVPPSMPTHMPCSLNMEFGAGFAFTNGPATEPSISGKALSPKVVPKLPMQMGHHVG